MRPFLILLLGLLLAGCDNGGETQTSAPSGAGPANRQGGGVDRSFAGTPAPRSIFEDPAGEAITLADFQGRPLLVNLWATWCAPCIAEMPTLDALAGRDKGLRVLAVSQDMNGKDKVAAFFAERRFANLQPYIDPGLSLMTELKVDTLPTTILYDFEGREVWRMTGKADWTAASAGELLKEAG